MKINLAGSIRGGREDGTLFLSIVEWLVEKIFPPDAAVRTASEFLESLESIRVSTAQ